MIIIFGITTINIFMTKKLKKLNFKIAIIAQNNGNNFYEIYLYLYTIFMEVSKHIAHQNNTCCYYMDILKIVSPDI